MKTIANDPISAIQGPHGYLMDREQINGEPLDRQLPGLTKREYIAIKMHSALLIALHASTPKGECTGWSPEQIASAALLNTDAIINALNDNE